MDTKDAYKDYIVAFLDILGFKGIINTSGFDDVLHIFQSIITCDDAFIALNRANDGDEIINRYNESLKEVKIHIMSDSIVVATPAWHPESLAVVVDICNVIQEQLYDLNPLILLRGAIAVGKFFLKDNLVFGKGLVDAYWAQEKYAVYPRIIISGDVAIGRRMSVDTDNDLPKDSDGYYYIDSLARYLGVQDKTTWSEVEESDQYSRLMDCIDRNLNGYSDDRVRQKYLWLDREMQRIQKKFLYEKENTLQLAL